MNPVLIGVAIAVVAGVSVATWKAPRLTSIILWSLVATIFFTATLLVKGPGPFAERALWITLTVPIIWTAFQFWTYWDAKPWRVAAGLISLSAICAVIVFLSKPMV